MGSYKYAVENNNLFREPPPTTSWNHVVQGSVDTNVVSDDPVGLPLFKEYEKMLITLKQMFFEKYPTGDYRAVLDKFRSRFSSASVDPLLDVLADEGLDFVVTEFERFI